MSRRVCAEPGCPTFTYAARCDQHRRERDAQRGSRQQRGYDSRHDRLRATYARRMQAGERFTCWRSGTPIDPANWHLGHCDINRSRYHGPECTPCNTATSGRRGCPHPEHEGGTP